VTAAITTGESAPIVAPASREAIRAARDLAIRRPSFTGLQARIRRERLTPVRMPILQTFALEDFPHTYLDNSEEPDPGRLLVKRLVEEAELDDEVVAMGKIDIAGDGRSLRTFTGGKASEVAIMACPKSHHMLHVEGATAEQYVISQQVAHQTLAIATEAMVVSWDGGRHLPDVLLYREHGGFVVREIKRDENDLRKPKLRRNIAIAAEIFRRAGIDYSIVYRREIFANIRHRKNAHLFASRGPEATWGEIVELLDPFDRIGAVASAQALVVRRRIEIDLTQRVHDGLPIILHPPRTIH